MYYYFMIGFYHFLMSAMIFKFYSFTDSLLFIGIATYLITGLSELLFNKKLSLKSTIQRLIKNFYKS